MSVRVYLEELMRVETKTIRNLAFAGMLASLPLASTPTGARADCGSYYCDILCNNEGGYIYQHGCDHCTGGSCFGTGDHCADFCEYCGGSWYCF